MFRIKAAVKVQGSYCFFGTLKVAWFLVQEHVHQNTFGSTVSTGRTLFLTFMILPVFWEVFWHPNFDD